jgi:lipopolysaccharide transport system permease protein
MAWTNMWRHRRFVGYFGGVFLRKLYARTWLGWLWLPLRPALWVLARIIVFGGVLGVASVDAPYPLFFLVATAAWQLFAQCATWSTRSVELNRATLRVLQVPRSVVVSAAAVPSVLEFLIYTAFVLAAVVYYFIRADYLYISFGLRTLLVPAGLLLLMALGIGIGFVTSTFAASARDVRFGLQYVLAFGYFLTPVIYPLSTVPEKYRPLVELNPVTGAIEMVKDGLFASHELSSDAVLVTVAAAIVIWIPGLWLVHRRELKRLVRT